MYRTKPEPVPPPWPLLSFRYYDHSCCVMNVGGHKNAMALREEYRNCRRALKDDWHAYMGVWWVYFDHKTVMITPSKREAEEKFEKLKTCCIVLREGNKGNKAVEDIVKRIANKPVEIESLS
jgi:hypothetical protein